MSTKESTRGISRMNYKSYKNGWLARYFREGALFSKAFSDRKYGSAEASKAAAEAWHKEVSSVFPPMSRTEYFQNAGIRPESGITGVRRHVQKYKGEHRYPVWVARWKLNGKENVKTFAVAKYGEEQAKQMAIDARRAVQKELEKEWEANYWDYRPKNINKQGFVDDPFAHEGDKEFSLHLAAERNAKLRKMKLEAFLNQNGKLFCEICRFSFEDAYGEIGKGLIEVHHLIPFSQIEEGRNTHVSELMCVCSNCHFAIHNGDPTENLRRLQLIFNEVSRSFPAKRQNPGNNALPRN